MLLSRIKLRLYKLPSSHQDFPSSSTPTQLDALVWANWRYSIPTPPPNNCVMQSRFCTPNVLCNIAKDYGSHLSSCHWWCAEVTSATSAAPALLEYSWELSSRRKLDQKTWDPWTQRGSMGRLQGGSVNWMQKKFVLCAVLGGIHSFSSDCQRGPWPPCPN